MLRPGGVACPAPARTFTTELSWAGSPQKPRSVMTGWFIVFYHRRTFTGWTGSLMGCELIFANELGTGNASVFIVLILLAYALDSCNSSRRRSDCGFEHHWLWARES